MSQSIDLLTTVAKFLETHDDLVKVSSETYRLPLDALQRMGFLVDEMYVNHDCITADPSLILRTPKEKVFDVVSAHPHPGKIASVVLPKDPADVIHIIIGLMHNQHWDDTDELLVAIRMIDHILVGPYDASDEYETQEFLDKERMKRLCKYDSVMRCYSEYDRDDLVDFAGHVHGRSLAKMFLLIEGNANHLSQLMKLFNGLNDVISFIDELPWNPSFGNNVQAIINNLGDADRKTAWDHYMK